MPNKPNNQNKTRNNNNNLIFKMNNENPVKLNKKPNQKQNQKRNNTMKKTRTVNMINKYRNKPLAKQPYMPIEQKNIQYMKDYYKNTFF